MASEVQYQRHLIDGAEGLSGYGLKLSNRFMAGVPDLFVQVPRFPSMIIEVKVWADLPVRDDTVIVNGLTALQALTLNEIIKAGGYGGWLAIHRDVVTDYIYVHHEPKHHPTKAQAQAEFIVRKRGTPWTAILETSLQKLKEGLDTQRGRVSPGSS